MSLPKFIAALLDSGHVRAARPGQGESPHERDATIKLLAEFEQEWRLEMPGQAPDWNSAAAIWGATMFYRAAQAALYREVAEQILADALGSACPTAWENPSTHYSVDLTFRFLPELFQHAPTSSSAELLSGVMQNWANLWPLSSVGMKGVIPASLEPIAEHAGLLQFYVDRIITTADYARLADPRVAKAAREALGAYAELSPSLFQALQHYSLRPPTE